MGYFPWYFLKRKTSVRENKWDVELDFIKYFFRIPSSWSLAGQFSKGTAKISRNRLSVKDFLNINIPIPKKHIRKKISTLLSTIEEVDILFSKSSRISSNLYEGIVAKIFENYPSDKIPIDKQKKLKVE